MIQFLHSLGSKPAVIFGIFGTDPGLQMRVDGSANEDKKGKEKEQSECESYVQESTLDFVISMGNSHSILHTPQDFLR